MRRNVELEINSANLIQSATITALHSTIVGRAHRLPTKTLINTWLTARCHVQPDAAAVSTAAFAAKRISR
jgi:hypothetical protein